MPYNNPGKIKVGDLIGPKPFYCGSHGPYYFTARQYHVDAWNEGKVDYSPWEVVTVNRPPEPRVLTRYFNVYGTYIGDGNPTRSVADKSAVGNRIGCVRVDFKEGQYDD